MRRLILNILTTGALVALFAMPAAAGHGGEPTVAVMKHLCNEDIQSEADFLEVENAGAGGEPGGAGTIPGLVATVLACPTIVMPGDTATEGAISGGQFEFGFQVTDTNGEVGDPTFSQAALCESDIDLDANGNGEIEDDVCLDVSAYAYAPVAEGEATVTETQPPANSRFGTLRFTGGTGDDMAVINFTSDGTINLDTSADPDNTEGAPLPLPAFGDDFVMLHVYNFQNVAGEMPNSAVEAPAPSATLPLTLFGFGLLLAAGLSTALVVRARR